MVLLDDLQWADRDTLALLEYLAAALRGTTVRYLVPPAATRPSPAGWGIGPSPRCAGGATVTIDRR